MPVSLQLGQGVATTGEGSLSLRSLVDGELCLCRGYCLLTTLLRGFGDI